jgi:ribonuclease-3
MMSIKQLASKNRERLREMEELLDCRFSDPLLLQQALVHSSFSFEQLDDGLNNETLEFLGDAVLDLAVSDMLFRMYPSLREGEMTKMRAELVREASLAKLAGEVGVGDHLMFGRGEESSGGRQKPSILAAALEAIIGAIYMDRGFAGALHFIREHFAELLPPEKGKMVVENAKSHLQEFLQEHFSQAPSYHLDAEEGPDHAKTFTVTVRFMEEILGTGSGSSKKAAEQQAAARALADRDAWQEKLAKQGGFPDK